MQKKLNKKIAEFDLCLKFYCKLDDNGSTTWFIDSVKDFINYYYNDKNIDLNQMLEKM